MVVVITSIVSFIFVVFLTYSLMKVSKNEKDE